MDFEGEQTEVVDGSQAGKALCGGFRGGTKANRNALTRLYILHDEEGHRIKIGVSREVATRMREIAKHMKFAPTIIGDIEGSFALEKYIHTLLSEYRLQGEWFHDCIEVRDLINALINGGPHQIGFVPKPPKPPFILEPLTPERQRTAWRGVADLMWPDDPIEGMATFFGESRETIKDWLSGNVAMPTLARHAFACRLLIWMGEPI